MEQENKVLENVTQDENIDISLEENPSKTDYEKTEIAKDNEKNIAENKHDDKNIIDSISSDDLDTNVNENILKSIGINLKEKQTAKTQENSDIKKQLEADLQNVDKLVQYGMLDIKLGRNLKKNILQKAFDNVVQIEKSKSVQQEKSKIFDEFKKNSNDFFKYEGRRDVLNYLQNEVSEIGMNDLTKISEIIQTVEKFAIKRYLTNLSHEKSLKDANEQAKQKLTANAQHISDGVSLARTFTRAEIGKMSQQEFEKYEKTIMKQLREGKIK